MSLTFRHPDPLRRQATVCGCLIGTALVIVALGRHAPPDARIDRAAVVQSVALKFQDLPDGSIVALNAADGAEIERVLPGVGGFIRVTMRSFAAERLRKGLSDAEPFLLARMNDGDLRLEDPLTGRTMLLNAFGPSNEAVFAELLDRRRVP